MSSCLHKKSRVILYVSIVLGVFFLLIMVGIGENPVALSAKKDRAKNKKSSKNEPIHVVSDRMEVDQGKKQIVFLGHVMAKKGDLTVLGDRMTVVYRKVKKANSKNKKAKSSSRRAPNLTDTTQIEKIFAQGNVKISKGDIVAIGDRADYYQESQKLLLTGHARISRGGDFISGERVIILLDENKSIVEGGQNEPVKATIYPQRGKDKHL